MSTEAIDAPEESTGELNKSTTSPNDRPLRLELPEKAQPPELLKSYAFVIALVHLGALVAIVPPFSEYLFSWSGVALAIAGHFVYGMLGINVCYHRLLTHRGFKCPLWLEHSLALLGICNLQDSPARWVAIHRMHHQHSDHQADPHTPRAGFWWSHVGWVLYRNRDHDRTSHFERYVRDLLRDPFYLKLEIQWRWFGIFISHALLYYVAGAAVGYYLQGTIDSAVQMGLSWFFWGVLVRVVIVLHGTWAVNSLTHVIGYRNYETRDDSRNHWLVALLTHGEGWHNNHHASPRAAAHGHKWWEFDMAWWVIRSMEMVGLATDVVRPGKKPEPADW
ncbi:MAG: fatty acid desaturase [Pirellulaceae bacterium]